MRNLLLILGLLAVRLVAADSSTVPAPADVTQPPVLPLAADPRYMQSASQAVLRTQDDPDVTAAEARVRQVRTENALRLEEAELLLELVRAEKGAAAGVERTPLVERRTNEIKSRLTAIAAALGRAKESGK